MFSLSTEEVTYAIIASASFKNDSERTGVIAA
jgi:hypothetical protein